MFHTPGKNIFARHQKFRLGVCRRSTGAFHQRGIYRCVRSVEGGVCALAVNRNSRRDAHVIPQGAASIFPGDQAYGDVFLGSWYLSF